MTALAVIAKVPEPGRVKTRLAADLGPEVAAAVAWACLLDTLDAAVAVPDARVVLALDGPPGPWLPYGVEVVAQRGDGLGQRLANLFGDLAEPAVVIAMDTPQVTPDLLAGAAALLDDADAVLGPADDGGYWLIGLRPLDDPAAVFAGIEMSRTSTGSEQRARLEALGLRVAEAPTLRDVDDLADVVAVAGHCHGRFAALARSIIGEGAPLR